MWVSAQASCEGRRLIVTVEVGSDQVGIFYDDRGATHEGPARWESDDVEGWVRRLTGEDRVSAWVHHAAQPATRREALAEALGLWVDDATTAQIVDCVQVLPNP